MSSRVEVLSGRRRLCVIFAASLIATSAFALPGDASADTADRQGGTIKVRGGQASFFPTSPDDGVILVPNVNARAVFDHDDSDRETVKLPTAGAVKLLADEDQVRGIVRRLGAPKDEDAYAVTLSQLMFDPTSGFSATAVVDDAPDRRLGGSGVDSGVPPVALGAVELVALDRNVAVGRYGAPREPSPATSSGDNTVYVKVTTNFPGGSSFEFKPKGGDCISDQTSLNWGQNEPPATVDISFKVVSSGGSCWIDPSVANWEVSIQPPGVDDINKLWVDVEVNQLSPWSWHAGCTTINQPHRPSCVGDFTVNGNEVNITVSPGS